MREKVPVDWIDEINFKQASISVMLELCLKCETEEEASKLRERYRDYCVTQYVADGNLGYIFGYCDKDDRKKLYRLFPMIHPMFGARFGREEWSK